MATCGVKPKRIAEIRTMSSGVHTKQAGRPIRLGVPGHFAVASDEESCEMSSLNHDS